LVSVLNFKNSNTRENYEKNSFNNDSSDDDRWYRRR